jgi:hypothetical protein
MQHQTKSPEGRFRASGLVFRKKRLSASSPGIGAGVAAEQGAIQQRGR